MELENRAFEIAASGHLYGVYYGEDKDAAILHFTRDAGYDSLEEAAEVLGKTVEAYVQGFEVTEQASFQLKDMRQGILQTGTSNKIADYAKEIVRQTFNGSFSWDGNVKMIGQQAHATLDRGFWKVTIKPMTGQEVGNYWGGHLKFRSDYSELFQFDGKIYLCIVRRIGRLS